MHVCVRESALSLGKAVHTNSTEMSSPFTDRAGSISTLDSLDFARYSDDGNRESDEKVAGKQAPLPHAKGAPKAGIAPEDQSSHCITMKFTCQLFGRHFSLFFFKRRLLLESILKKHFMLTIALVQGMIGVLRLKYMKVNHLQTFVVIGEERMNSLLPEVRVDPKIRLCFFQE